MKRTIIKGVSLAALLLAALPIAAQQITVQSGLMYNSPRNYANPMMVIQPGPTLTGRQVEYRDLSGTMIYGLSTLGVPTFGNGTTLQQTSGWGLNILPSARPNTAYAYLLGFDDAGGSASGLMTGGAAQKTYAFSISVNRPSASAATGDSNDSVFKGSYNNYAVNDSNFIIRGLNIGINGRSPGVAGMLEAGLFGAQNKSGSTLTTLRGLTVHPENYGSVSGEMGGIDVVFHNEAAAATLQYGIRIRNNDQSNIAAVAAALLIPANAGNTTGFTYGVDLNGSTIGTADVRLHTGAMILTGSGDPNGSITVAAASIYIRTGTGNASTTVYVNAGGGNTWTAITVP